MHNNVDDDENGVISPIVIRSRYFAARPGGVIVLGGVKKFDSVVPVSLVEKVSRNGHEPIDFNK